MAEVPNGASEEINAEEQPDPELVKQFLERIRTTPPENLAEELALEQQRRDAEQAKLKAEKAAAEKTSRIDALTELGNKRAYEEELTKAIETAISTGRPFSFIMADIDRFKGFNDKHKDHQAGDAVLWNVARILEKSTKGGPDRSFRIGGEEFVTLAPVDLETAINIAERQRKNVELATTHFNGENIKVNISSGVSCFDPREIPLLAFLDPNDHAKNRQLIDEVVRETRIIIMREADTAMYEAKEAGRNMVAFKEKGDLTVGIIRRDPQNSGNISVERIPFVPNPKSG